ncbi:unnamed protein product [Fraxinus pennsylvanica]|uniref:Uncharacterized protein n=1 Tax=Fraxinus pennsylvanica TaxID=56036 RepID=A0AAD2DZ18_9LAMI|nr:unnamed protein product [Fraxinus pennsylvanica]
MIASGVLPIDRMTEHREAVQVVADRVPSGLPHETRAARQILKDYIDGKLPHVEMPPDVSNDERRIDDTVGSSSSEELDSDSSDVDVLPNDEHEEAPSLEHVLVDLNSFDMDNELGCHKTMVQMKSSGGTP